MIAEKLTVIKGTSVAIRAPLRPRGETSHEVGPHQGAVAAPPDPEVPTKPARRRCTADDKSILFYDLHKSKTATKSLRQSGNTPLATSSFTHTLILYLRRPRIHLG
jgi:hypothetical protein